MLLLGVFTNLCCEALDVRKRQWIISKNKINQSINQSINHLWGIIDDWGWEREERIGERFRNVVVTRLGG